MKRNKTLLEGNLFNPSNPLMDVRKCCLKGVTSLRGLALASEYKRTHSNENRQEIKYYQKLKCMVVEVYSV